MLARPAVGDKDLLSSPLPRHGGISWLQTLRTACLQGTTYEEMTEAGHSTETKEVSFEPPGESASLLQQVPGFENSNPQLE
eukprot:11218334-Lingulodinium_polyedra.AAC.1